EAFFEFISECEPPDIDIIAVTAGPGLEPALWVGINFAKALALVWKKPFVAVNHMEGHVMAALASRHYAAPPSVGSGARAALEIKDVAMPVLALLISGGHTELVVMKKWLEYELVGQTRDDAVGEAFDKVARMLALPYPGGPEISRLAEIARSEIARSNLAQGSTLRYKLPRPMIDSATCDFSFAGLKTAVLYLLKNGPAISEKDKKHVAHEFENAVADVLWKKTSRALEETRAKTLVIGGGVSANKHIRRVFAKKMKEMHADVTLRIPSASLTTDNAIMIALAGFYRALRGGFAEAETVRADGNRSLAL
ncbi:MAG: tRNA (adenosine(37)-N6)-threonylcarbamoyltransferase complex transferase subunit TsaD, partial [Patescibacteria group bacterium]|nr:tRNA (adenosine(37)-N6)-threonylcarbamoyltransferase complex transferase subunit TsaD [Patescibacteria group bacterium]